MPASIVKETSIGRQSAIRRAEPLETAGVVGDEVRFSGESGQQASDYRT
jgi:hypothetical protein